MNQKGTIPILVLISILGVVGFLIISSAAPFKEKLFAQLFPKPASFAVSSPISEPISPTPIPTPAPDITPPSVTITNPINGSTVRKNSTVNITANASDIVAVAKVEFYVSGSLLCTDTQTPYSCSWRVPKLPRITYPLSVQAYDTSGNTAQSNISVTSK